MGGSGFESLHAQNFQHTSRHRVFLPGVKCQGVALTSRGQRSVQQYLHPLHSVQGTGYPLHTIGAKRYATGIVHSQLLATDREMSVCRDTQFEKRRHTVCYTHTHVSTTHGVTAQILTATCDSQTTKTNCNVILQ